jgi:uncharacterized membrane protein
LDLLVVKADDSHIDTSNTGALLIMAKTFSFAILHFTVAFTVGYLLTGSAMVGGMLAVIEPACNTVVFYFHEKAWKRYQETEPEQRIKTTKLAWLHAH